MAAVYRGRFMIASKTKLTTKTNKKSAPKKRVFKSKGAKPQPSADNKLELFLQSLSEQFSKDPTFPGITISYLPQVNKFYGSINRYNSQYGKDRVNLITTQADTLVEVFKNLAAFWKSKYIPTTEATNKLRELAQKGEF